MSKIRLYGDTSGYIDVAAPATADNSTLDLSTVAKTTGDQTFNGDVTVKDTLYVSGSTSGTTKAVAANSTATEVWHYIGSNQTHFRKSDDSANLMSIDSSGRVTMPYQPSFLVFASPSRAASDYVYSFGIIDHNVGNHYNNATGTFTAPIAGRYFMTAAIWATASSNSYLTFMVNDNEYVGGHIHANGNASSGYASAVLSLNAGDYVNIRCFYSIQGSTPRNHWSGMLIG